MMYHKFINDREVFSECKTIRLDDGTVISNPSEQQILDAGWLQFIPPIIPPQPQTEPGYDQIVDAVKKMLSSKTAELSDEDAIAVAALFPTWASKLKHIDPDTGEEKKATPVETGERLWFNEELWAVLQPHTPQESWRPDISPSLFVRVSIEEWPEWVQPKGSTDAYNKDAQVTHVEKHWVSEYDNNVWEPGVYGWREA